MTTPRWIIPATSVVAALALGIGGAIVGAAIAPHSTHAVAPKTETTMVLAPLEASAPHADGSAATVSGIVSQHIIQRPVTDPKTISQSLKQTINQLNHAVNPVLEILHTRWSPNVEGTGLTNDPCAPLYAKNTPRIECPPGLRGTISGPVLLPDFTIIPQAYPPTHDQFQATGNPYAGDLWCDGLNAEGTNSVPFGILSTSPANFIVRVHALDDLVHVSTFPYETSAVDAQNYADAVSSATTAGGIPAVRNCLIMPVILLPDTEYVAEVTATNHDGTVATASVNFNSSGAPIHPSALITTLGENMVFVSAMRRAVDNVDIRAYVIATGSTPTCSGVDPSTSLAPVTDDDVSVSDGDVASQNAPADFTRRHSNDFAVPEGSTILVCAVWLPAGTNLSSPGATPTWESSALLQSPDRVNARLTFDSVTPASPNAISNMHIKVFTTTGPSSACGSYWCLETLVCTADWASLNTGPMPRTLCDLAHLSGNSLLNMAFRGDGTTDGTFVVQITSTLHGGTTTTTVPVTIGDYNSGRGWTPIGTCRGACNLPAPTHWGIDLSYNNDRVRPARGSIGVVGLTLDYSQGGHNGVPAWSVSPTTDVPLGSSIPDYPHLDLTKQWIFPAPTVPAGSTTGQPLPYVTGQFELNVDRPVDYIVRFTHFTPGVAATSCAPGGGQLQVSGHVDSSGTITMPGACVGLQYTGEIELIDAQGHHYIWSPIAGPNFYWGNGDVRVTRAPVNVNYTITAQGDPNSILTDFDMGFDQSSLGIVNDNGGRCIPDGRVQSGGVITTTLALDSEVEIRIYIAPNDPAHPELCAGGPPGGSPTIISAPVSLADLYSPAGVTITAPDVYNLRVVLHATP